MLLRKASDVDFGDIIDLADLGRWYVETVNLDARTETEPTFSINHGDAIVSFTLSNRGRLGSDDKVVLKRLRIAPDDYLVFVPTLADI